MLEDALTIIHWMCSTALAVVVVTGVFSVVYMIYRNIAAFIFGEDDIDNRNDEE